MMSVRHQKLLFALILPLAVLSTNVAHASGGDFADLDQKANFGDAKTDVRLRSSVLIKAKPNLVWLCIHEQRTGYPELEYAKVLAHDDITTILEQRFNVALLGKATCTIVDTDRPPNRIDYKLLKSDMFSVMDGSWIMTPAPDNQSTRLELYCHAGVLKQVPRIFLKIGTALSLKRHLEAVKRLAEKSP
jgi:hypothetical protein